MHIFKTNLLLKIQTVLSGAFEFKRMMNSLSTMLLVFGFFIAKTGFTQTEGDDIVTLKNGEELRGYIIEQKPGVYIRLLQSPLNDTLKIEFDQIEMLRTNVNQIKTKSESDSTETKDLKLELSELRFNDRKHYVNFGVSRSGGEWNSVNMHLSALRTVSPNLQLGLGINVLGYDGHINHDLQWVLPITLELRQVLRKMKNNRIANMLNLSAGYSVVIDGEYYAGPTSPENFVVFKNGLFLNPSYGFRVNLSRNVGLIFEIGYQFNRYKTIYNESDEFLKIRSYHNMTIGAKLFF
jgi:hypothetical protein